MVGLLDQVNETFDAQPGRVLADAGYCNQRDLSVSAYAEIEAWGIDGYVVPGREGEQVVDKDAKTHPATHRMVEKLLTPAGRERYAQRKWLSELRCSPEKVIRSPGVMVTCPRYSKASGDRWRGRLAIPCTRNRQSVSGKAPSTAGERVVPDDPSPSPTAARRPSASEVRLSVSLAQSIYCLYIPTETRFLEEGAMAQRQTTTEGARKSLVNLRVSARDRDLIDRAAAALGKNRSEFMLDATRQAAEDALLDRVLFRLGSDRHEAFVTLLDGPPSPNKELARLLSTPAPWEE